MKPAMSMYLNKEDMDKAKQSYDKGYEARKSGVSIDDKPAGEINEWLFGWKDADELYV